MRWKHRKSYISCSFLPSLFIYEMRWKKWSKWPNSESLYLKYMHNMQEICPNRFILHGLSINFLFKRNALINIYIWNVSIVPLQRRIFLYMMWWRYPKTIDAQHNVFHSYKNCNGNACWMKMPFGSWACWMMKKRVLSTKIDM